MRDDYQNSVKYLKKYANQLSETANIEIFRSLLKSKKNNPNVCLIPRDIITTIDAQINVINAFLLVINFGVII